MGININLRKRKMEKKPMARKSSGQDRTEGAMDKVKGRAKEAAGAVTGDKSKKSEGRSDQMKGTFEEKKGKLKNLFE
jgi:uncharacterized protein YjbJ (UPF0337 family)